MHSSCAVGLVCLLRSCLGHSALLGINTEGHQLIIWTKKRKEKTIPVGVNLIRSQVLYWAAHIWTKP